LPLQPHQQKTSFTRAKKQHWNDRNPEQPLPEKKIF
jgi:hypothetical protein